MSKFDKRGNPVSYHSQPAIDRLDHVFELLHAYQADPLAEVDAIIAEHPDFAMAHAFRAGALATAADKAFEPELIKSVKAAEALSSKANDRERLHISASRAWLDGDWERGVELWGRASIAYPPDLLALQYAHVGDFFLGYSHMLRDRVARTLPDRLVHHSTIFELHKVESYRGKEAARQQKIQRDNENANAKRTRQSAGTATRCCSRRLDSPCDRSWGRRPPQRKFYASQRSSIGRFSSRLTFCRSSTTC